MSNKMRFFLAWTVLFISIFLLSITVLSTIYFLGVSGKIFLLLILLPLIFVYLVWQNKVEVPPKYNFVYEWRGEILDPLEPGWHYVFPYFGMLNEGEEIPMNSQMLYVLSGVRDGLSPKIINQYTFGTASNLEAETGDFVRMMYKLELKCEDPIKLVYEKDDPYGYIASVVEQKVNIYVHGKNVEQINDNFVKEDWNADVNLGIVDVRALILNEIGIDIVSFIPVDVINTPEVEESRRAIEIEIRKKELNNAKIDNDVQLEKGKGRVLTATLSNMSKKKSISEKADEIRVNSINAIKTRVGVNSVVALKFATNEKKLDVILEASKAGNITYVDDSNGGVSQATAMGFALRATNQVTKP